MSLVLFTRAIRIVVVVAGGLAAAACRQAAPPPASPPPPVPIAQAAPRGQPAESTPPIEPAPAPPAPTARAEAAAGVRRDLSKDESRGGHTIARHVGRSDTQLRERLRAEPSLSVASTYTDLPTAETTVEKALRASAGQVRSWTQRRGRRANLAVDYTASAPVGRSLRRNARSASPCASVVVVLRWDERRDDSYVLTSYPDCRP